MNKEECAKVIVDIPDYAITIFWIFVTVMMLAVILVIIVGGLKALIECYQDRRRAYLRNKQIRIELELLEKQKTDNVKST